MSGDITMECPRISPCTLCTRVHAVSNCMSEGLAYKRSSADLAIEVEEDNMGFLSLEVVNEHAGRSVWYRLSVQEHERTAHCVFLVVIIVIAKMATVDNLE